MLKLGKRNIFVNVNQFQNETKVHIRKYIENAETGEMVPTKKGIALSEEEWEFLLSLTGEVNQARKALRVPAPPKGNEVAVVQKKVDDTTLKR